MNLIQESFQRLFPETEFPYHTEMEYNRRLSDFNANIRLHNHTIAVNLNLQWKDIDSEIKIGLIQSLLLKILKKKKHSPNIELYNNFLKNIPILTEKTKTDPYLEASFQRVNQQFFQNQLDQPNLQWGQPSYQRLASYNLHQDSITVSTLFKAARTEILDYLMYHELLHKKHQFYHKNGRSFFHTIQFKEDEKLFPYHQQLEEEIKHYLRRSRRKSLFSGWW